MWLIRTQPKAALSGVRSRACPRCAVAQQRGRVQTLLPDGRSLCPSPWRGLGRSIHPMPVACHCAVVRLSRLHCASTPAATVVASLALDVERCDGSHPGSFASCCRVVQPRLARRRRSLISSGFHEPLPSPHPPHLRSQRRQQPFLPLFPTPQPPSTPAKRRDGEGGAEPQTRKRPCLERSCCTTRRHRQRAPTEVPTQEDQEAVRAVQDSPPLFFPAGHYSSFPPERTSLHSSSPPPPPRQNTLSICAARHDAGARAYRERQATRVQAVWRGHAARHVSPSAIVSYAKETTRQRRNVNGVA